MAKVKVGDTGIEVEALETVPDIPGLPEEYRGRKCDALQVPVTYMGVVNERVRALLIIARFNGAIEGDGPLYPRGPAAGFAFTTRNPADLLFFMKTDPFRPGQPRYDWYADSADQNVKYGFLRFPETHA